MALPRGIRNNNPLNIRHNRANAWQGRVSPQTDPSFVQFASMSYGIRAAFIIMFNYTRQTPGLTLADLVSRWAPPTENDSHAYAHYVSNNAGIHLDAPVSSFTVGQWQDVLAAMALYENGRPISRLDIAMGYRMAADARRV